MTKFKDTYNYDREIKKTLSDWSPDIPESQIGQDWEKISEAVQHPTTSFSGNIESFIVSIKSNIGFLISGTAVFIITATLITYFTLTKSADESESKENEFNIDDIEITKDNINSQTDTYYKNITGFDNLSYPKPENNNIISDVNKNPIDFEKNAKDKIKQYEVKSTDKSQFYNVGDINEILPDKTIKTTSENITSKIETANVHSQVNEKIVLLPDSIICYNMIKDKSLFPIAGSYDISYQKTEGENVITYTRKLKVLPPVIATFEINEEHLPEISFINLSENAKMYEWEIDGINYYTKEPVITLPGSGNYSFNLLAFDQNDCSDKYTMNYFYSNDKKLSVPNIFTPDGDGVNDEFVITISGENYYHLSVLNNEGKTVFQSIDKNNVWDGINYLSGEKCPNGTYYYVFRYRFDGETEISSKTGIIYLMRKN